MIDNYGLIYERYLSKYQDRELAELFTKRYQNYLERERERHPDFDDQQIIERTEMKKIIDGIRAM